LTLIRKQAVMVSSLGNRQGLRQQAEAPEPAARNVAVVLGPVPPFPAYLQLLPEEAAPLLLEPEEILVADPRGGLTPSQMVDQKLLARLHSGPPGLILQATGRPQDVRRIPR
jgi:hypothetical protein